MLNKRTLLSSIDKRRSLLQRNVQFNTANFSQTTFKHLQNIPVFMGDYRVVTLEWIAFWQALVSYWKKFLKSKFRKTLKLRKKIISFTLLLFSMVPISQSVLAVNEPALSVTTPPIQTKSIALAQAEIKASEVPIFQIALEGKFSQRYSAFHRAVDIPRKIGTPIKPVAEGVVERTGWEFGYGQSVIIKHKDGYMSRYAHLSKIMVKPGDKVTLDSTIGLVGSTGWSTGPHLHLEIYQNGKALDPQKILPYKV